MIGIDVIGPGCGSHNRRGLKWLAEADVADAAAVRKHNSMPSRVHLGRALG